MRALVMALLVTAVATAAVTTPAGADQISPNLFSATLSVGFETHINKTVTIFAGVPPFVTYSDVGLALLGPPPVGLSVVLPVDITGSFDRSIDRNFNFNFVDFIALAPGTYDFVIAGEVDGVVVARESDHIVVQGTLQVPESASLTLLGLGLAGLCLFRHFRSGS